MERPCLFHLHYHVPDVEYAAAALSAYGIEPVARFGTADGESVSLAADETPPDGFTLRLQTNRGGTADVTLTPGPRLAFDHFGVVVDDVSAVVERARQRDWGVTENERRTFLVTPWGFRIELQQATSDLVSELGDPADCRFTEVILAAPVEARDSISRTIRDVVGDVTNFRVAPVRASTAAVREAFVDGARVENPRFERGVLAEEASL
ncbi:hypothetical protein [Haloferax sp. YSSS75]|uniref:hypothetical protein n=1 Tax=Haloferax sp. YSSS75 TaxID=3388564 RepID=UPI00398D12FE